MLVALVSLASFVGFGILICCRHDSKQPMLIITTFILIMFTILNTWVFVDTSKWIIWLPVAVVMVTLAAVMPIHFMGDWRESYTAVSDNLEMSPLYLLAITIVEVPIVMLRLVFSLVIPQPVALVMAVVIVMTGLLYRLM